MLNLPSYNQFLGSSLSKLIELKKLNLNSYTQRTHELKKLTKLETLYLNDKLMERDNKRPFFSFTRKNSVNKKSPKRRSPRKSPKRRSPRKSPKRRSPRD